MTKTTARVRHINLYTIERDGQPVAQAEAISQAEAVALWVASQQQPVLSARMATPREARALAHLPLLFSAERPFSMPSAPQQPERDPRVPDMFEDVPPPTVPAVISREPDPETVDAAHEAERAIAAAHEIPDAEFIAAVAALPTLAEAAELFTEPAADQPGEPAGCLDAAPTAGVPGSVCSAVTDVPTHAERMASAYAAGVEIARQGHTRWSVEFLDANASALRGMRGGDAGIVHAEMLRGFKDGQPIPEKSELKRQVEAAAVRAGGKIVAKYRDPETGQTWSGRGLQPRWLAQGIEAGKTLNDYLVEGAQA